MTAPILGLSFCRKVVHSMHQGSAQNLLRGGKKKSEFSLLLHAYTIFY